ncbi:iron-containing alcohol dehydrogenase [Variovorax sp. J22P240]|uniref:iron-containing alcohol dehydrogenase n=1 Tax=Variovorax sp. J22P240 TaxID=3053514 RepID=UPI002576351B|nr:iron-containing alcohol dehydrogenase [Variovorax sp. J22P240]MDM0002576.1 iron-containing alcohol dehydrogenase [Variovorax sp. J22P240]
MHYKHTFRATSHALRIYSGQGALANLPSELARSQARRAVIVCGRTIREKSSLVNDVLAMADGRVAGVFAEISAGAPRSEVEAAAAYAQRLEADALIAIGAGSVTKAARVVAIRLGEAGALEDLATQYVDGRAVGTKLRAPKVPIYNVLTAATSSQNRSGASIRDVDADRQLEFFDPKTRPQAVFWDAQALLTAPPSLVRSSAGMEYWWASMGLAGSSAANPLVLASRRQCWEIARNAASRIDDPTDWTVRAELCAAAMLRTRDEDDGGAPLGAAAGSVIRMHAISRATYMLAQGLFNRGLGPSQSEVTLAVTGAAIRAFGDLCPEAVSDLGRLLGAKDESLDHVADAVEVALSMYGPSRRLTGLQLTQRATDAVLQEALRTFNCNADGWMDDKTERLARMLNSVTSN